MTHLYEAIVVGGLMAFGLFTDKGLGDPMIRRPLVMGTLVGLLLGDLQQGIIMGAAIEVVFLGTSQIGGALPSDTMTGSIFGTAFALITNQTPAIALTLAIPISMLAVALNQLILFIVGMLVERFKNLIEEGKYKQFIRLHWGIILFQCSIYFIVGFLGILLGTNAIQSVLDAIPNVLMSALTIMGQILPALGMALLLNMLWDKKIAVFTLLGFVLSAYLELPLIAIACIGVVIAVSVGLQEYQVSKLKENKEFATELKGDDFFD